MEKNVGSPCKKTYDPFMVMEELLSTVNSVYEEKQEINASAIELNLAELKVKKFPTKNLKYQLTRIGANCIDCGRRRLQVFVMGIHCGMRCFFFKATHFTR